MRRASISLKRDPALEATRISLGKDRLVYVLVADKKLKYKKGRSSIAYIGTTKTGIARVAQSVAVKAEGILSQRGIRTLRARILTCKPRQRVKMWHKLERAALLSFRQHFGELPRWNIKGSKMKETDEFEYFQSSRLIRILEDLS